MVILEGVNHAQYATGDMPDRVVEFNIVPEVSDVEARQAINNATNTFITYWVQQVSRYDTASD